MDAAERLFVRHGFRATSLRAITSAAKANLGAVNYHFSSKDALILAVLRRRLEPMNAARLALLDRFEQSAAGEPVTLPKILEALFRPPVELIAGGDASGRNLVELMSQALAEPSTLLEPLIQQEFAEKNRRFHAAIQRALPYLSSDEVHWRLHFAQGVFLHAVAHADVLELSSGGRCRVTNAESVLQKIIAFCEAGLTARDAQQLKNS